MNKNTFSPKGQRYEAPKAEIIAIEHQSVLCASVGNAPGGGNSTQSYNLQEQVIVV